MAKTSSMSLGNDERWGTWAEIKVQYNQSLKKIEYFISDIKDKQSKDINDEVQLEIAGSIKSDLKNMVKEMEKKALYEFNTLDRKELEELNLTDKQMQIALFRQKYSSYTKIAEILDMNPGTVFKIYKSVLHKVIKFKEKQNKYGLEQLSPQQKEIYILKQQGKTKSEIAKRLGISINSVKTQYRRIKEKIGSEK
ncbi:MAG: hypothetical protein PWQ37_2878 [Candidatus Petromonas sp.]|jgi:DNA-binding CsgD family transcriptional regulator|nr:hypothetical protein [Candidatus Petromonas sp.]